MVPLDYALVIHLVLASMLTPLAYWVAVWQDREREQRTVFNMARALAIIGSLRIAALAAMLLQPTMFTGRLVAGQSELPILSGAAFVDLTWTLGWLAYVWFEIQWSLGKHPWQRPEARVPTPVRSLRAG